jgi:dTDP-glucose 4,6-dehydratase
VRILIAGGAGFIGSNLTDRFLAAGHHVIAVDNLSTGRLTNLNQAQLSPNFSFLYHDVTTPLDLRGPVDWIFHFASSASPPKYLDRPVETLRVNGEGAFQLLELARRKSAAFFLASTSEIYGDPLVHPQPETYWGNVNSIGPRSVYDEAKRYAEAMTCAYSGRYGVPVRIIRIFNTYGPRMDPEDGLVVTNIIVQGLRGEPITIPLPLDDPRQRKPDTTRAKHVLGWEPVIPVRDGLRRTTEHFKTTLRPWEAVPPQPGTRENSKLGRLSNQVNTEAST